MMSSIPVHVPGSTRNLPRIFRFIPSDEFIDDSGIQNGRELLCGRVRRVTVPGCFNQIVKSDICIIRTVQEGMQRMLGNTRTDSRVPDISST